MFENFPYTDMHQLNLDWIIQIAKDFLDQYTHLQELISNGETSLQNKTTDGLDQLQTKADNLESLLQEWYNTHSEDIANELTSAVLSFSTQANQIASEVIASIPEDYTELSNNVVELTRHLNYLPDGFFQELTAGGYYPMSGTTIDTSSPTTGSGWSSAVISCSANDIFLVTLRAVANPCAWAFINSSGTILLRSTAETLISRQKITAPENSAYLVVNNANTLNSIPTVFQYRSDITLECLADTVDELITKYNFTDGKYYIISNDTIDLSNPSSGSGWTSCKASCGAGDIFSVSGRSTANPPLVAFTDSEGNVLKKDSPEMNITNAKYTAPTGSAYIIVNDFLNWYAEPKCIKYVTPKEKVYIVDVNGNGDFTSLTNALASTSGDIIVKKGTYNIVSEYKSKFGSNIFNQISDNYSAAGMFRYGPYIYDRKVTFETGAVVVCDLTGELVTDGTHRFSAFNLAVNAEIYNMTCLATGTWYLIHDDFGNNNEYTNIIENCILIGTGLVNHNIIGGGCRNKSTNIVRGTYMNNGENAERTARYHNYNSAIATPTVIIENCKANGYIDACYNGTQSTPKMTAIIHNCESKGVRKTAESAQQTTDNVNLYSWANVIE